MADRAATLDEAARFRQVRAEVREALRTRSLTLADLFERARSDELLAASKVASLMWVIPGVGKVKTAARLEELGLPDDVRIGELDEAARSALVELATGRLVVVSGPSGVGKGTVIQALSHHVSFHLSVSATTREKRPGEVDGEDYHFVTRDEFEAWVAGGRMLEWAEYAGNLYGTPRQPVVEKLQAGHDVILEIEVQGARQVREAMADAVLVFILPPSIDELADRLRGRGDTANVAERLETAKRELQSVAIFDHTVVNDEVDRAADELRSILRVLPRFRMK